MRNKETIRKLLEMRLSGMVEIYEEQTRNSDYEKMTFGQRFNLIVEVTAKEERLATKIHLHNQLGHTLPKRINVK